MLLEYMRAGQAAPTRFALQLKLKGKGHNRIGHEGPEGDKGTVLLFL
jgi:hypothetical protein